MLYKFKRPENYEFPQTYYKFMAKDKNSENIVEYRVQDLTEDYYEIALDLMVKYFVPDETFCSSKRIPEKENAIKVICEFWRREFKERLSIACFKEGSNELIAANCLVVHSKNDPKDDTAHNDQDISDIFEAVDYTEEQFDVYNKFGVNQYLTAYGLCVRPDYRGRGIATEMLKARVPILKALGLTVTSTAFSAIGSQVAAKKAGYHEVFVISYEEIANIFPRFDFSTSETKMFKTMALQI